ncbi:MAG TPA: potassium channel family protein [Solirubrobacterales bacterium]|nr:potassium channel family protein [Solirubrobacterales bacterium]
MASSAMRDRRSQRWVERAERIRDAFGLVLALVLITYVLTSLLADHGWTAVLICLSTTATSVVALTSSHVKHRFVRLAIWLSLLSLALTVVEAAGGGRTWLNLAASIQVLLLAIAMGAVLRRVVSAPEVGARTILGALSVYTVLGLLFTYVYGTIARIQDSPFFEGHPHTHGGDFLFFSYTTLTTTGFGDLVPGGQPGRMISGIEMMIGQIFLVTLVAGLVSLWRPGEGLRKRQQRRSDNPGDSGAADQRPAAG